MKKTQEELLELLKYISNNPSGDTNTDTVITLLVEDIEKSMLSKDKVKVNESVYRLGEYFLNLLEEIEEFAELTDDVKKSRERLINLLSKLKLKVERKN